MKFHFSSLWRSDLCAAGNGENSVLACREWRKKCFGVAGMARKVFWRGGDDERRPRHEGQKGREIQIP